MITKNVLFNSAVKKQIQDHYDKEALIYDSEDSIDLRAENDYVFWHHLQKALGKRRSNLILDVGGGTGRIAVPFINKGHEVVIVDISRKMLEVARKKSKFSRSESNLQIVQGDAECLPFRDVARFDLALSLGDVLSYCNIDSALGEMSRILRTDGAAIVGVDNRYALAAEVLERELDVKNAEDFVKTGIGRYPREWGGHLVKAYTPEELKQHLGRHSLSLQDIGARPFMTRCLSREERKRLYRDPSKTSALSELELMISSEPSILGASSVLFAVAKKIR